MNENENEKECRYESEDELEDLWSGLSVNDGDHHFSVHFITMFPNV